MVIKNLLRRAVRSLLTIAGIAIGVAAVVALGAMAQGIAQNYTSAVGLANDLLVTQANAYDVVFSSLDESYGERIAAVPGVDSVEAGVFGWINVDNVPYFLIYGYEPGTVAMTHYRIVEGKPVTGPGQLALGRRAAESLNLGLDNTLRLYGVPYRIVGIYETGQAMEESGGVVTKDDAQTITQKQRQVSLFQIGLHRNADPDSVAARIQSIDDELTVTKSSEYEGNEQMMAMLQGFAWGIAAIAVLIGGLGMMSAMVMSVMERTREIGTLRAVGWSRWRVVQLILGEAIGLSLIGGIIGSALGAGLAWLAGQAPGVGAFLEGSFRYTIFVQGMVTALALGIVGGLFPAWTAANLQPVEALRYEGGGAAQAGGWLTHVGSQSFRNLWRRRTRTLLSAAGIGIGVATLVMLGGITDGMIDQLNGLAGSGGTGNITVMQRDVADMSLSSLDERIVSQIRNMPEVKAVSPMVLGFISNRALPLFIISGLDPNSAAMAHYQVTQGRHVQRPNEMLIGKVASETYKVDVGDTMTLYDNRYRVVGLYETGVAFEDGGGVIALREAQRLLNRGRTVSFIFVDVQNAPQAQAVVNVIDRRFPEARASLSSEFAQNTDDMQSMFAMVAAIRILAMLVGGIVVANTMIMSIFERTREIGTLRAVGWEAGRILRQILQESLYLCTVAGVLGALFGVVFLSGLSLVPVAAQFVAPRWSAQTFIIAFAVALVLGALGGIYPAWRASKLRPVEALRYE
ncbi:MAG TPA: ABC transporter permease [Caldilineaceae bacterium]|nr:ABC transporter permease [Caldilineaceae bacterium]